MGTTRIELAIDDIDTDADEADHSCNDVRLAWLAHELGAEPDTGHDFDALWDDR
jgi:hypothetical protein